MKLLSNVSHLSRIWIPVICSDKCRKAAKASWKVLTQAGVYLTPVIELIKLLSFGREEKMHFINWLFIFLQREDGQVGELSSGLC